MIGYDENEKPFSEKRHQIERNKEYKITIEFLDNYTALIHVHCPNGEKYFNQMGVINNFEKAGLGVDLMLNCL